MKEILMTILKVAFVIIAYFAIRFAVSLLSGDPACGWDVTAILGVTLAMIIFVIQYLVNPDKSLFLSLGLMLFFVAGILFWVTSETAMYSLQAAVAMFFLFSVILFINSMKSIKSRIGEPAKSVGSLVAMCATYLLIIPAVALAERFF